MRPTHALACLLALSLPAALHADDKARFDLAGPNISVRVTRAGKSLPISEVPNLQPGDKLWVKADLPATQSNHLLLIVAFLRGTTNEPPDSWFTEIETWDKKTAEGTTIDVPADAQQAIMFVAPETGGDFKTLRSAVKGRPGLFIRADSDLNQASFEQQRIERYLAAMKQVPPNDQASIKDHSAKLAATLALKPNDDCFKQPVDQQVNCLTQSSAPVLLEDGHGQTVAEALTSGPSSDFFNTASATQAVGGGVYSAYVGTVIDLVHIVTLLRTAQYQYIPGIAFPKDDTLNLKLNTPPSFVNPKTVIVIGLPAIQKATPPPLKPHDPDEVACLLHPRMTLQLEGAPLVFSTSYAHDLVLHLNRTGGPTDLPLTPDAYEGGLQVAPDDTNAQHKPLESAVPDTAKSNAPAPGIGSSTDVTVTGTVRGFWGFDSFEGPTLTLQQVDGKDWKVVGDPQLMAGKDNKLALTGDGTACVKKIALINAKDKDIDVTFAVAGAKPDTPAPRPDDKKDAKADAKPAPDADKNKAAKDAKATPPPAPEAPAPDAPKGSLVLDVSLTKVQPGGYALAIQQFGDKNTDKVPLTAYNAGITVDDVKIHAGDDTAVLTGSGLKEVVSVDIAGDPFTPTGDDNDDKTLHLKAPKPVSPDNGIDATVKLKDGRTLKANIAAAAARPGLNLLSFKATPAKQDGTLDVILTSKDDIPLNGKLTFVVQTKDAFPRTQTIEVATADNSVHTTLSIANNTLVLQDDHTAVATLDPLKAFGQSAFGKLQMRPVAADDTPGNWTPLGTLVRTPRITAIHCDAAPAPASAAAPTTAPDAKPDAGTAATQPAAAPDAKPATSAPEAPAQAAGSCTAEGTNLFHAQSFAASKDFTQPTEVPTGYADASIKVPAPADGTTLYLKLRDDPNTPATITLPQPAPAAATQTTPPPPSTSAQSAQPMTEPLPPAQAKTAAPDSAQHSPSAATTPSPAPI